MNTTREPRPMNLMMIVGAMEVLMDEMEETGRIISFGPSFDTIPTARVLVHTRGLVELADPTQWSLTSETTTDRFSHIASAHLYGVNFYTYLTPEEHAQHLGGNQ